MKTNKDTKSVRAFNAIVRKMLNDVNITKIAYYSDYTHPNVTTKKRKIFKFAKGGVMYGHGLTQRLNLDTAMPIIDKLNTIDGEGWLPWGVHTIDGVEHCKGIYKHTHE